MCGIEGANKRAVACTFFAGPLVAEAGAPCASRRIRGFGTALFTALARGSRLRLDEEEKRYLRVIDLDLLK